MKSDNCLINVVPYGQIAFKKSLFFRLDQPVLMHSTEHMSQHADCSIATGTSNSSCSDALTLAIYFFTQRAGLPY